MRRRSFLKLAAGCGGAGNFLPYSRGGDLTAADVLKFPLPDALTLQSGKRITTAGEWPQRRKEIIELFAEQVYGCTPAHAALIRANQESLVDRAAAFNGAATRKQITLKLSNNGEVRRINVLLYVPVDVKKPVPVITGLNFEGNHAIDSDSRIILPELWKRDPADAAAGLNNERRKLVKVRATEDSRGRAAIGRWPVEKVIRRGYALATAYYGDIDPDFADGLWQGVRPLLFKPGQQTLEANEWGALGGWAWGLSRIADYLQSDNDIDGKRIAVVGHSRLGKAALWAAAQDERFRIMLSNESGVGGASLYRANSGETIEHLNTAFPHWFCENFHRYTGHPDQVPVDGNLLLAAIGPRPLYVASAEDDLSSNPRAEFYSAVQASAVYKLLGRNGLAPAPMPAANVPVFSDAVAYHMRSGKHNVTEFDWDQYLSFVDRHFKS
jgi:hypothetical protein